MEKILLILESDDMQKALGDTLAQYEVCTCTADNAVDTLAHFQPNALVLDLFLPGTDGFVLLESCRQLLPPVILLLTILDTDYVRKRAPQLGVGFIIQKPCATEYIAGHLTSMLETHRLPEFPDNEALAESVLNLFHLHAKERATSVLRHAIVIRAKDPDCLLTKDIYGNVCVKYGASTDAVDQAIRRCLRNAWLNRFRHPTGWALFFPDYDTCPSNWVFISTLATYLRKKYPSRFRKGS